MREGDLWERIYMTEDRDIDEVYRKNSGLSIRQHIGSIF